MADLASWALLMLLAAVVGEGSIEFLVAPLVNKVFPGDTRLDIRTIILNLCSALLGVGIAFSFNLGLFQVLGATAQWPVVDLVLTGIVIGRGSNYAHGVLKRFFANTDIITIEADELRPFKL